MDWIQWWAVVVAVFLVVNWISVLVRDTDKDRRVVFFAAIASLVISIVIYGPVLGRVWGWW
jgi:hypothetical protein